MEDTEYGRRSYDHLHSRVAVLESQMHETRDLVRELRASVQRLESLVNRGIGAVLVINALGVVGAAWLGGHH